MWRSRRISDWIDEVFSDIEEEFRPLWNEAERCLEPLVDVSTTEDEVVVTVDLPCVVNKEDISLNVSEESLEVKAVMHRAVKWERWGTVQKDIGFNSFRKVVRLPDKVDPAEAKAKFSRGILTVTLPRVRKKFDIKIE
ncbi:MAG: Hsp20/alpha crystallin family protein [Nitrososphaerales archaeon]